MKANRTVNCHRRQRGVRKRSYGASWRDCHGHLSEIVLQSSEETAGNLKNRGVVLRDGQTLKDLYEERVVLYEKYADITIDEENKNLEETLQSIVDSLELNSEDTE